jgi:hypothetical protein
MNNPNPYEPPAAELVEPPAPDSRSSTYLLVGLVSAQFLATLFLAPTYFEFVKTGMASGLALLLWVPGSGCLYAGALLQLSKRRRGKYLFLVSAVCLGLSVRLWAWSYALAIVAAFGAAAGAFGWWLVHKKEKANAKPWRAEA